MKARLLAHFETNDPILTGIVSISAPYNLPTGEQGSIFEAFARSIAAQQISGAVARTILGRLTAKFGGRFPSPAELVATPVAELRAVGFSGSKVAALHDLAAHYQDGRLPPDSELAALDDEAVIERCIAVRGIGRWTVQMVLMFQLGRHDVMPIDDFGVRNGFRLAYGLKGMPRPKALLKYAERWKPYRSAGAWYMWRAVDLHQAGQLPKRVGRAPRIECEPPREKPVKPAKSPARRKHVAKRTARPAAPRQRAVAKRPASKRKRAR
jgi:DNA-3-methyladenine glycosylase II